MLKHEWNVLAVISMQKRSSEQKHPVYFILPADWSQRKEMSVGDGQGL